VTNLCYGNIQHKKVLHLITNHWIHHHCKQFIPITLITFIHYICTNVSSFIINLNLNVKMCDGYKLYELFLFTRILVNIFIMLNMNNWKLVMV